MVAEPCINCGETPVVLWEEIRDFEYDVPWKSRLVQCPSCGLIQQDPKVEADKIHQLYPSDYLAVGDSSRSRGGVYGKLKAILAGKAVRSISSSLPHAGTFVEVGCGNGHLMESLSRHRPDVTCIGVDIKEAQNLAREKFTFIRGQFEDCDIAPSSADLIYFSNLLEHVADPKRFLRRCFEALKPGGRIQGVTPSTDSVDRRLFGRRWGGYHYPRHTFLYNRDNLRALMRQCGFDDPRARGGYSFWYVSLANLLCPGHGRKKRGLMFAAVSAAALPVDKVINLFRCHGSMTFEGTRPT